MNSLKQIHENCIRNSIRGKSTETALHEMTSTVKKYPYNKEYTLATLLNIEETFNNVFTKVIHASLTSSSIDKHISQGIITMLSTRNIQTMVGSCNNKCNNTCKSRTASR